MITKFNKKKVAALLAMSSLALLTGCGKTPDNVPPVGAVPGASTPGLYPGGCIPLNAASQIAFNAINASYTGNYLLKAGTLPVDSFAFQYAPETVGTVTLGGTAAALPANPYGGALTLQGMSRYNGAQISVNITPMTAMAPTTYPSYYPTMISGPVNVTGALNLGPVQGYLAMIASNNYYNMSGFPYPAPFPGFAPYSGFNGPQYPMPTGYVPGAMPTTMPAQQCISGIAFRLERMPPTNQLGFGAVWLYLNGQAKGISLAF